MSRAHVSSNHDGDDVKHRRSRVIKLQRGELCRKHVGVNQVINVNVSYLSYRRKYQKYRQQPRKSHLFNINVGHFGGWPLLVFAQGKPCCPMAASGEAAFGIEKRKLSNGLVIAKNIVGVGGAICS